MIQKTLIFFILLLLPLQITLAQESESEVLNKILVYDTLGYDFAAAGKYDSSEYYYLRTLQLKESQFGPNDRRTGFTHVNLAVLYRFK